MLSRKNADCDRGISDASFLFSSTPISRAVSAMLGVEKARGNDGRKPLLAPSSLCGSTIKSGVACGLEPLGTPKLSILAYTDPSPAKVMAGRPIFCAKR